MIEVEVKVAVERHESSHFVPGEDDCDRCDELAVGLIMVQIGEELFNEVLCEGHLQEAIAVATGG